MNCTLVMYEIADRLEGLLDNSYSPYSKYRVGCVIKDRQNRLFDGVNVENASFGLTICAERAAICNMIKSGSRDIQDVYITRYIILFPHS